MESGYLRQLEVLNLSRTSMDAVACEDYAQAMVSKHLPAMKVMEFSSNSAGDEGAKALGGAIAFGSLKGLKEIWLGYNVIADDGMKALSHAMIVSHLTDLSISSLNGNRFQECGYSSLDLALRSGKLNSLQCLFLYGDYAHRQRSPTRIAAFSSKISLTARVCYWPWSEYSELNIQTDQILERKSKHGEIMTKLGGANVSVVAASHGKIPR